MKKKQQQQRSVELESHSRRNNLIVFNKPEEKDVSYQTSANVLRRFTEVQLKISKKDSKEISVERVHRIGKLNSNNSNPRPLIDKFALHKDKKIVLAQAKNLRGTNSAVARDFSKDFVEKRKLLVPILKDAKKSGHDANLAYDKLYINGQLYRP